MEDGDTAGRSIEKRNRGGVSRPQLAANARKSEPEAYRQQDLPAPIEMRLKEFGGRSRFD